MNVLFDNLPEDNETITLKINDKEYTVKTNNGIATFNINLLKCGTYTLNYSINATELHDKVINSSTLNVNKMNQIIQQFQKQ